MKVLLFTSSDSDERVYLTDESASSSYGSPVLLVEAANGSATFGPGDELGPGAPAFLAVEAFLCDRMPESTLRRARRTKAATEAARRFCEALPLVRRTPAPGYVAVPFGGTIGR